MQQETLTNFIDFLQDNFETELYRNDIGGLLYKLFSKTSTLCRNYNLNPQQINNRIFLYAFFLIHLDVNILPFLDNNPYYGYKTFQGDLLIKQYYSQFIKQTISQLKTFIVPGNKKVIECDFLYDDYDKLPITKIIIEEGVETIAVDAFSNLKNLREIYLPASLKNFGDLEGCSDNIVIYFKPVSKSNGKKGVGFTITSNRDNKEEWFTSHLKKY